MRSRVAPIIFFVIFAIAGGIVTKIGFGIYQNAKKSMEWPTVNGAVTSSEIERNHSSGSGSSSTTYGADIAYDYQIKGETYSANKVSFGEYSSSDIGHARKIVNKYPVGKVVNVYYNPDDLYIAVLEPGIFWSSYIVFVLGLIFFSVGFFGAIGTLLFGH
ncbi:MAG: DUF3592 domain-containing protein [Candidatus Omnitrophica bacterium]|nr:DUF3592 domain-containing protein [Candidatus Omnitrophota bacterium]